MSATRKLTPEAIRAAEIEDEVEAVNFRREKRWSYAEIAEWYGWPVEKVRSVLSGTPRPSDNYRKPAAVIQIRFSDCHRCGKRFRITGPGQWYCGSVCRNHLDG